ncbi:asparagine synthase C-terminal domain-containing protein [Paucibacter sediminis]|uniref:asparagine synthase (glutamine-hydrolyzing) n=1 Tax=Paucibacter sediminis TaxID=3019553 RepID=A0AA95NAC5_9BURK|nr:asparagine synthase C-terminal domain-containing protein [Paucibacter sp. S2-9]WIT11337.1 asparagine synthase C-terminal domain-containing protein [Paucibacter sp. S2-9]
MHDLTPRPALFLGQPRFDTADMRRLAAERGPASAWMHLLQQAPQQALARVGGDFALATDLPSGESVMAVDRFAIHTLCYRVVNGQLRWAMDAKQLADADTPLDPQAIFDYLYFHCIPSPRTIYRGIYRVPPGHLAIFRQGQLTLQPYWRAAFEERAPTSLAVHKAQFMELLSEAVRQQLDGSQAACFLSGGTDSSSVAGMLARHAGKDTLAYSIGFDAEGYDEMAYAKLAAQHFGVQHRAYYVTPADLVEGIPEMARHLDQPFGNSSVLPAYYCAKLAKAEGVSKLLAGDGGDELYGGNARYATQRLFGFYGRVPGAMRRWLIEPMVGNAVLAQVPLIRKGGSYVRQAKQPMPDRLQNYNLIMRVGPEQVLTPGLLQQLDTSLPLAHQRQAWESAQAPCSELNRELAFDWRYTLGESDLPKVRAATALAGLNVGFPMLDQALLDFSLHLPSDYKLRGNKLRWFFKEALKDFLPHEIISKRKQGFGLPFGVWTTRDPALQKLARRSLEALVQRGLVRGDYVHTLLDEQLPAYPGYYGEMVWILMMLEQWLEHHMADFHLPQS